MRTSMITTFGRRRCARATALAPSAASPTTRMCGARESERRSPSRTTSWSSTIRQVMSAGTVVQFLLPRKGESRYALSIGRKRADLHHQTQLLRFGRRLQGFSASVADALAAREVADGVADRLRLGRREVRASPVEALVARQLLGPLAREALEEVLARAGLEVEDARPDPARAGLARRAHD